MARAIQIHSIQHMIEIDHINDIDVREKSIGSYWRKS